MIFNKTVHSDVLQMVFTDAKVTVNGEQCGEALKGNALYEDVTCAEPLTGSEVRVSSIAPAQDAQLTLCEVQVYEGKHLPLYAHI